jgi:hypothetical protein
MAVTLDQRHTVEHSETLKVLGCQATYLLLHSIE